MLARPHRRSEPKRDGTLALGAEGEALVVVDVLSSARPSTSSTTSCRGRRRRSARQTGAVNVVDDHVAGAAVLTGADPGEGPASRQLASPAAEWAPGSGHRRPVVAALAEEADCRLIGGSPVDPTVGRGPRPAARGTIGRAAPSPVAGQPSTRPLRARPLGARPRGARSLVVRGLPARRRAASARIRWRPPSRGTRRRRRPRRPVRHQPTRHRPTRHRRERRRRPPWRPEARRSDPSRPRWSRRPRTRGAAPTPTSSPPTGRSSTPT